MATNPIEIDATAAELEAAAKAAKWSKEEITNLVYPVGSCAFFYKLKTNRDLDNHFGTTDAWSYWGAVSLDAGPPIYVYQKIK